MSKKKPSASKKNNSKIASVSKSKRKRITSSGIMKSTMTPVYKMGIGGGFYGGGYSPNQVIVDFASEGGRRGEEVRGLLSGPISTSLFNSQVARRRSRHAVLTNAYAKRAIDVLVSNVVGSGHKFVSLCPDATFKKQVEDLWNDWAEQVDSMGKMSFGAFEALACRSMFEGGDSFVRFRVRMDMDDLVVPLQLQLFEAEQVPSYKNELNGSNPIIGGIEINALGSPVAYHMLKNHPGDFAIPQSADNLTGQDTVSVPAYDVIHLHDIKRPQEIRGMPALSQALILLSDLDRYMDAEMVRKKAAALIGGFIRRPADASPDDDPFITEDSEVNNRNSENDEVHIESMEPGTFPILPDGYDVTLSSPADVGSNFKEFLRQQILMLCASLNITYEQLTQDVSNSNDRVIRATMLEFKRIAEQLQKNVLQYQFCRRVFKRWFEIAVLSRRLTIPAGMSMRDAMRCMWIADPWDYLNPKQELDTQVAEIRAGFTSRSAQIIKRGGIPEEVDKQIYDDQVREYKMGLVYTTNTAVTSDVGIVQSSNAIQTVTEPEEETPPAQIPEEPENEE